MINKILAINAFLLRQKGLGSAEIGKRLGVPTREAQILMCVGAHFHHIEKSRLTWNEITVLKCLAQIEIERSEAGIIASPKSHDVSRLAGKRDGWCRTVVIKRIFEDRLKDPSVPGGWRQGLGFVRYARNGHIMLTPAGWAIVHAMESGR